MNRDLTCALLTEAGETAGLGHLSRCVALYDAFEWLGVSCVLVLAGEAPAHVVGSRNVLINDWRSPVGGAAAVKSADIAVVDSYVSDLATYEGVASSVSVATYLDDTARLAYPPGFVVNGSPAAATLGYIGENRTRYLLGLQFQIVRPEFASAAPYVSREQLQRVLVIVGGSDATGARDAIVRSLAEHHSELELDVVVTPRSTEELIVAMCAADVAVSAAGQTLYELAAVGTPAVAVCVADNQVPQARALAGAGTLLLAGVWGEDDVSARLDECLMELRSKDVRATMSEAARALLDGRGAQRIAKTTIAAALERRVKLTAATASDEADVLELANDPVVRAASFSAEAIPADRHHDWFAELLGGGSSVMYLARDRGRLAAQIRFDVDGRTADVNIALAEAYRGLGLGRCLLERAQRILSADRPEVAELVAHVKSDNRASRGLFEGTGFVLVTDSANTASGAVQYAKGTLGFGRKDGAGEYQ